MRVYSYFDNLEPDNPDAEIWRFMPLKFFEDLMATEELHFNREDRFPQDEQETGSPDADLRYFPKSPFYLPNATNGSQASSAFVVSMLTLFAHRVTSRIRCLSHSPLRIARKFCASCYPACNPPVEAWALARSLETGNLCGYVLAGLSW